MPLVHTEEVTGSIPVSPTRSAASCDHVAGRFCCPYNTEVHQRSLAAQPLTELLERIASGGRGYLGVDRHRDGDLAVPQDLHRHARMHVERRQQGPAGLPGAVDGDPGHSGFDDAAIEAAAEVSRLQRRPVAGREHQTRIDPGSVNPAPVGFLLFAADHPASGTIARRRGKPRRHHGVGARDPRLDQPDQRRLPRRRRGGPSRYRRNAAQQRGRAARRAGGQSVGADR